MREQETREVVFPETTPQAFDLAMKYLEDPLAIRKMKAQDALQVVQFYDQYEFTVGLKLCDQILKEAMDAHRTLVLNNDGVLDELVNICIATESLNLEQTKRACQSFLDLVLGFPDLPPILSVENCKKLHPIMMKDYSDILRISLGVTKEELESPLFPRVFVEYQSKCDLERRDLIFTVSGTDSLMDGIYHWNRIEQRWNLNEGLPFTLGNQRLRLYIEKSKLCGGDYALVANVLDIDENDDYDDDEPLVRCRRVLWKRPYSRTHTFPSGGGDWIPVHKIAMNRTIQPVFHISGEV
jgi:hypothetical protein